MTHPEFTCIHCGSGELRRSRRTSLADLPKILMGKYPFRCLNCKERMWIDLFRKGRQVRCPRCLTADVISIPDERVHFGFWKVQLMRMGARAYRCSFCAHKFVSFKKTVRRTPESHSQNNAVAPEHPRAMASAAGN
ncbi:MAG TPA: hypothetical protein VKX25_10035 [Bryobacteraceae bacterium]|jgi:DNA-directed RNA polymerase subunit RPC12/RpoP|nr:hypothetical protein [Bryobacteraceae bacterium]